MKLHADLTQRAAVHASTLPWQPSPARGVERRLLHRWGDEVAQATSIVRYAAGSRFDAHVHGGGEEFLVLEGVFQDEHGDYPAGSYIRNPPGTRHAPRSEVGTTLFVKLWQFDPQDKTPVNRLSAHLDGPVTPGTPSVVPLYQGFGEEVRLEQWPAGSCVERPLPDGGEFLLLDGAFTEQGESFVQWSWLRLPAGAALRAEVGPRGATVWAKLGHLRRLARLALPGAR